MVGFAQARLGFRQALVHCFCHNFYDFDKNTASGQPGPQGSPLVLLFKG